MLQRYIRLFLVSILGLLMVACAAKPPFELAPYDKAIDYKYPPISITLNDGYVNTGTGCTQYGCYTYRDNSDFFVANGLRKTTLFDRVDINNAYAEYTFNIQYYDSYTGSEAAEFSKLMLGAATLFVVPTVSDRAVNFAVSVRYKNDIIKEYKYEAKYTKTNSLFIQPGSESLHLIDYFVSLLMQDIQADQLFVPVESSDDELKV